MEKFIVHIGYHKSASTFLQSSVFPQLPVNYLFFSGPDRKYLEMVESKNNLDADAIHAWIDGELERKYQGSQKELTVLSHEELSGHPNGYDVIDPFVTAENLKKVFPNAKILMIIRNQLDYLTSVYTFRVAIKGYETRSFAQYVSQEGAKGLFAHLEYHRLAEHYQNLFGAAQVLILPMELLKQSPDELLDRMLAFMQLPRQNINRAEPVNVSTKSVFVLSFWRAVNYLFRALINTLIFFNRAGGKKNTFWRLRRSFYDLKGRMTMTLNNMPLAGKTLDIKAYPRYEELLERFRTSNARLEKLAGCDLSVFGYPVKQS
jgi:hypothetical protein